MNTVEEAYCRLAAYVLGFIDGRQWECAGCHMQIFQKMASGSQWFIYNGGREEKGGFERNPSALWEGLDAAIYLRDDLLEKDGSRIWGVFFTLYPDGRFNVEYDYNKPDDYEESDSLGKR
ncbi:hypothetical protein [Atopomonas hussainii]|uniref:hypothetical protein n=1 Tax=Atopomonas hussainii TaxID=1429083 RepID=UPI00111441FB|nr:hypothetical protein [Atopomonas hussainii]